jgi:hypothetical protein
MVIGLRCKGLNGGKVGELGIAIVKELIHSETIEIIIPEPVVFMTSQQSNIMLLKALVIAE